jgi:predicted phage-related endonuclease
MSSPVTIGSSDVPAILGLSRHRTPHQSWLQLVGLHPRYEHAQANTDQDFGHIIEPALLMRWEQKHGLPLVRSGTIDDSPAITRDGWKHARPDGYRPSEVIVEAKTARSFDPVEVVRMYTPAGEIVEQTFAAWGEDGTDQIPMSYKAQVAWQMHVLDINETHLVAFCPMTYEVRAFKLTRDLDAERVIVDRVEQWVRAYVHPWTDRGELVPPPPPSYEVVSAMHASGGQSKVWLTPDDAVRAAMARYTNIAADIRSLEAEADTIRASVCKLIGDAYGFDGLCRWERASARESVALAKVKKAAPDLYAELARRELITHSNGSRRFVALGMKETSE